MNDEQCSACQASATSVVSVATSVDYNGHAAIPRCDRVPCIFSIKSCSTSDVPVLPVEYNYSLKALFYKTPGTRPSTWCLYTQIMVFQLFSMSPLYPHKPCAVVTHCIIHMCVNVQTPVLCMKTVVVFL